MPPKPTPAIDRVLAKIIKHPSGCWEFVGARISGYGVIALPGRDTGNARAHRVTYEHFVGPIPQGLVIDHLCRNPACVNPDHLEPVLHAVNMERAYGTRTLCSQGHTLDGIRRDRTETGAVRIRRYCKTCHAECDRRRSTRNNRKE